jgi:2-C-methyl-D-erythritol 2,4-cyclodiphosphate synthase
MNDIRIGIGEDIHRFVPNKQLVMGGVKVPFEKGLLAHSDGDVVYHALADALLGSLALGDIGHYFPTDDPNWDNVDSALIVAKTMELVKEKGYEVSNADIIILAEKPKIAPILMEMRSNIASLLNVDISRVGVQAGTEEGLGEIGKGEGIRAKVAVLVSKGE